MNTFNLEKLVTNMSRSWIIGCSILTYGIINSAYLNGISKLSLLHTKRKYKLELQKIENYNIDLTDKIKTEDKIISYYWKHINIVFMIGITCVSIVVFRSRLVKA